MLSQVSRLEEATWPLFLSHRDSFLRGMVFWVPAPVLCRYHKECVDPWLLKNRLCPMCKRRAVDDATLAASQALEEGVGGYDEGGDDFEDHVRYSHYHSMLDTTGLSGGEILLAEREDAWSERSRETRFILAVISAV